MENKLNKSQKKADMFMLAYQESCADFRVESQGFGAPNISLKIGLYELTLSARTYLSKFEHIAFLFYPKVNYIPNPEDVHTWLKGQEVIDIIGRFISPKMYRYEGTYHGIKMMFDVSLG